MNAAQISLRCLRHPLVLTSLGLLLLNDHWLKEAAPSYLTGKLSDFAGLYFFPFLLAALLGLALDRWRVPPRLTAAISFTLTLSWFAAIKTLPAANLATARLAGTFSGGLAQIILDPSDLWALLSLLPAAWLWLRVEQQPRPRSPGRLAYLALGLAAMASLATSPIRQYYYDHFVSIPGGMLLVESAGLQNQTPGNHEVDKFAFSADGLSWSKYREITDEIWEASLVKTTLPRIVCRPIRPVECYRITGQPQVERSLDGGLSWQMDWKFPLERGDYFRRAGGLVASTNKTPLDLAVLELPDGPRVLAAMGVEGALVRLADGSWQRVAVINATPTPFKAENVADALSNLYIEELLLAAIGLLLILLFTLFTWPTLLRSERARGKAGWALRPGWLFVAGIVLLYIGGRFLVMGGREVNFVLGQLALAGGLLTVVGPLWAWTRVASLAERPRYVYLLLAITVLSPLVLALAVLLPLVLWALWIIPTYIVALLPGLGLGLAVLGVSIWLAVRCVQMAVRVS